MKFICDSCGKETSVSDGFVNLVCQSCGCFDLRFDHVVEARPLSEGYELKEGSVIKKGESFCGKHAWGSIWKVVRRLEPDEVELPSGDIVHKDDKRAKKARLLQAIRKLKSDPLSGAGGGDGP